MIPQIWFTQIQGEKLCEINVSSIVDNDNTELMNTDIV